jgi:hypothetical protein
MTFNTARHGIALLSSPFGMGVAKWLERYPTLPLPGAGDTLGRWRVLAEIAAEDVCLAKLLEAHYDAQAILAELGAAAGGAGELWGVWAAEPPSDTLQFEPRDDGGVLNGLKSWCSGAHWLSHALVTAHQGEQRVLVAVALDASVHSDDSGWQAVGMQRIATAQVQFDGTPAVQLGTPGQYVDRPAAASPTHTRLPTWAPSICGWARWRRCCGNLPGGSICGPTCRIGAKSCRCAQRPKRPRAKPSIAVDAHWAPARCVANASTRSAAPIC